LIAKLLSKLQERGIYKVGAAYLVSAWALAKLAELASDRFAAPDWIMQVILATLVAGLPLALLLTWFFNLKAVEFGFEEFDDGTDDVEVLRPSVTDGTAALAAMSVERNSIAVLPFTSMSSDVEDEYFADGLAEELLNLLARINELKVTARTSSFAFKGKNEDIRHIARQLRVTHVLEGSVRRSLAMVRITLQLIRAEDGFHIWSETYDRQMDNIFAVQDEISAAVTDVLKIKILGEAPRAYETEPAAFAFYLKGNQLLASRNMDKLDEAAIALDQALVLDPNYPAALVAKGSALQINMVIGALDTKSGTKQVRELLDRALSSAPSYSSALAASSFIACLYEGDWDRARSDADAAYAAGPGNAVTLATLAMIEGRLGEPERAEEYARKAIELDPLRVVNYTSLGGALLARNKLAEARMAFRKTLSMSPRHATIRCYLGVVALLEGNPQQAIEEVADEPDEIRRDEVLIMAHFAAGNTERAERELSRFIEQCGDSVTYNVGRIHAHAGHVDEAFEWLQKALDIHDEGIFLAPTDNMLASLHDDPRWPELIAPIGCSNNPASDTA
jgi:TolB-like protein